MKLNSEQRVLLYDVKVLLDHALNTLIEVAEEQEGEEQKILIRHSLIIEGIIVYIKQLIKESRS